MQDGCVNLLDLSAAAADVSVQFRDVAVNLHALGK